MSLTIDDPRVIALANTLANQTGESVDALLLRLLLSSQVPDLTPRSSSEEISAFLSYLHSLPRSGPKVDHAELLYDEHGLPR